MKNNRLGNEAHDATEDVVKAAESSKQPFYKSLIFKCLCALLTVLLLCGVFLTIMNGLLEVTDEEKFQRILSSIYGKNVTTTEQDVSGKKTDLLSAKINNVYLVEDDGNYIVNVTGKNAYQGEVICWVVVKPGADKKSVGGIGKVQVPATGNSSQTFLNKINSSVFNKFEQDYKNGIIYSYGFDENGKEGEMYIKTDASYTMRGVCNAVNGTIQFMNAYLSGGDIVEEDPWKDYAYHALINMNETTWEKSGNTVTYSIVTKGNGPAESFEITVKVDESKTVKEFNVTKYGSTDGFISKEEYNEIIDKNVAKFIGKNADYFATILGEDETKADNGKYDENELISDATKSTTLCLAAAAFATSNYDLIINTLDFTKRIDLESTSWTAADGKVTFKITTLSNSPADPFEVTVTVNAEGKIEAYTVDKYGSTDGFVSKEEYNKIIDKNVAKFIGKDASYFKAIIDEKDTNANFGANEIIADATKSTMLRLHAGAFATANFEYCLTHESTGGQK